MTTTHISPPVLLAGGITTSVAIQGTQNVALTADDSILRPSNERVESAMRGAR
ncbi:hypothetical protein [Mycetocola sp.]|uniref:hypothetical protein n=1 Tax=Mycetocola sp. TaxID=1871042 RepID=UPI003989EA7A